MDSPPTDRSPESTGTHIIEPAEPKAVPKDPGLREQPVGPRRNLLDGDVGPLIFWLALPVLAEQFLNFWVGFYDTWLSGRIGAEATSAIGMGAYTGWLASLLFTFVGAGTAALVARSWGADDLAEANRILNRSMSLAAVMGIGVCGLFWAAAPLVTQLFDMQPNVAAVAINYLRTDAFGHIATGVAIVGAAALRGSGDMRTPLVIFGLTNVVNILFSTLFVFGYGPVPAWGVTGIAAGTVTARVFSGVAMTVVLMRGRGGLKLEGFDFGFRDALSRRLIRIGGPAATDGIVTWVGHFLFLLIIARVGMGAAASGEGSFRSAVFAAHIVGVELEAISFLLATAWGHAAAAVIGQSLGAGQPERAVEAGWVAIKQSLPLAAAVTLGFGFGAEFLYRLMHRSEDVIAVGVPAFRLLAAMQIPLIVGIILVFCLRGAGDTRTPLRISLLSMFCVRLPLAYLGGIVLNGGLIGAWAGMFGDVLVKAILTTIVYRRGDWREIDL